MKPVIQEEITGCAIACSAVIADISYKEAKKVANSLGIYANDPTLWSQTQSIRVLLNKLCIWAGSAELTFRNWENETQMVYKNQSLGLS